MQKQEEGEKKTSYSPSPFSFPFPPPPPLLPQFRAWNSGYRSHLLIFIPFVLLDFSCSSGPHPPNKTPSTATSEQTSTNQNQATVKYLVTMASKSWLTGWIDWLGIVCWRLQQSLMLILVIMGLSSDFKPWETGTYNIIFNARPQK